MTNEHTSLCGIYELPLRIMAFETGLDMEMLFKIMKRFEDDKKAYYKDGWLSLTNYEKFQVINQSMKINADNAKKRIPEAIIDYFKEHTADTVDTQRGHNKVKVKVKVKVNSNKKELKKLKDSLKEKEIIK